MNLEVEAKFQIDDLSAVRKRLIQAGATLKKPRVFEKNSVYDDVHQSMKRNFRLIRLRQDEKIRLTFKGPPPADIARATEAKVREEIELEVADFDKMGQILGQLGYHPAIVYEKYRETFLSGPYFNRVAAAFINSDGSVEPQFTLADIGTAQITLDDTSLYIPKISASPSTLLISWLRDSNGDIRAKLLDFDGNIISASDITEPFPTSRDPSNIHLSSNDSDHLVSWASGSGIYGQRVANDGSPIYSDINNEPDLLAATSGRGVKLHYTNYFQGKFEYIYSDGEDLLRLTSEPELTQVIQVDPIGLKVGGNQSLRYLAKSTISNQDSMTVLSPGGGGIISWHK